MRGLHGHRQPVFLPCEEKIDFPPKFKFVCARQKVTYFDWSMSEDGTDLLQVVFHGEIRFVFFVSSSGFMLNTLFLTIYAVNFEKLRNFSLMTE